MPGFLARQQEQPDNTLAFRLSSLFHSPSISQIISALPPPDLPNRLNPLDALAPSQTTLLAHAALLPGRNFAFRIILVCLLLERGADPDALSSRARTFEDVLDVAFAVRKDALKDEKRYFLEEVHEARRVKKLGERYEIRTSVCPLMRVRRY
jgi:hypothetical protein